MTTPSPEASKPWSPVALHEQREPTDAPFTSGHRLCAGCGASIIIRAVLSAADAPVVMANATGCVEVATTVYPYSTWGVPWIHSAFGNAASTIAGVEAAYRAFRRRGRLTRELRFLALGGDGGTYDIGLQALSGAFERGHRFVYICYDNEAYMNTGYQRSSATPLGAWTTTTPPGKVMAGKRGHRKDLSGIAVAHNIPYVAQASPSHYHDLVKKARKAFEAAGPAFLNILCPCVPGWKYEADETVTQGTLAVETCYWPLYEVVDGRTRLTYRPERKLPVAEWLKTQGRFKHLFDGAHDELLAEFQAQVDRDWEALLRRCDGR